MRRGVEGPLEGQGGMLGSRQHWDLTRPPPLPACLPARETPLDDGGDGAGVGGFVGVDRQGATQPTACAALTAVTSPHPPGSDAGPTPKPPKPPPEPKPPPALKIALTISEKEPHWQAWNIVGEVGGRDGALDVSLGGLPGGCAAHLWRACTPPLALAQAIDGGPGSDGWAKVAFPPNCPWGPGSGAFFKAAPGNFKAEAVRLSYEVRATEGWGEIAWAVKPVGQALKLEIAPSPARSSLTAGLTGARAASCPGSWAARATPLAAIGPPTAARSA